MLGHQRGYFHGSAVNKHASAFSRSSTIRRPPALGQGLGATAHNSSSKGLGTEIGGDIVYRQDRAGPGGQQRSVWESIGQTGGVGLEDVYTVLGAGEETFAAVAGGNGSFTMVLHCGRGRGAGQAGCRLCESSNTPSVRIRLAPHYSGITPAAGGGAGGSDDTVDRVSHAELQPLVCEGASACPSHMYGVWYKLPLAGVYQVSVTVAASPLQFLPPLVATGPFSEGWTGPDPATPHVLAVTAGMYRGQPIV